MEDQTKSFQKRAIIRFSRNWFNGRDEVLLFVVSCSVGIILAVFGATLLNGYQYNFGRNLIGVFAPPLICLGYSAYVSYRYGSQRKTLVKIGFLYLFQLVPYAAILFQLFQPTGADDFSRYHLYAKNMLANNTLWGGDKLFFTNEGYHYVTQPGYRYVVYLELLVFGGLCRAVQFFNIGLYVITAYFFQSLIIKKISNQPIKIALLIFVLLFSPYAIKNSLMGLPEWFTAILLMWVPYSYFNFKDLGITAFLLGLVPFFRQNTIIALLLILIWMILRNKQKIKMLGLFILPALLPLYHNLYYAGEWRFFVNIFELPFIEHNSNKVAVGSIKYELIFSNLIHYLGFDLQDGKLLFSLIAALFLPYATALYFWFVRLIPSLANKLLFLLTTVAVIVPAILLGNAYYPRFEFVNSIMALVFFLMLYKKSNDALKSIPVSISSPKA